MVTMTCCNTRYGTVLETVDHVCPIVSVKRTETRMDEIGTIKPLSWVAALYDDDEDVTFRMAMPRK